MSAFHEHFMANFMLRIYLSTANASQYNCAVIILLSSSSASSSSWQGNAVLFFWTITETCLQLIRTFNNLSFKYYNQTDTDTDTDTVTDTVTDIDVATQTVIVATIYLMI